MGGLKAVGQLLHAGVMRLLALVRRDVRIRIQQPGQQDHGADRAADLAEPPNAAAEGGTELHGRLARQQLRIGAQDGLRAVAARFKIRAGERGMARHRGASGSLMPLKRMR